MFNILPIDKRNNKSTNKTIGRYNKNDYLMCRLKLNKLVKQTVTFAFKKRQPKLIGKIFGRDFQED